MPTLLEKTAADYLILGVTTVVQDANLTSKATNSDPRSPPDWMSKLTLLLRDLSNAYLFGFGVVVLGACVSALVGVAVWGIMGGYIGTVFGTALGITCSISRRRLIGAIGGAAWIAGSAILGLELGGQTGGLTSGAISGALLGLIGMDEPGFYISIQDTRITRTILWAIVGALSSLAGWAWIDLFTAMEL